MTGRVVSSRRGELSVLATSWVMASKALRPLPTLHKDLSEEARVRKRYVDLVVRDEARAMVRTRAAITRSIRETLFQQGYLEVETPILQPLYGGAAARPKKVFDESMLYQILEDQSHEKVVMAVLKFVRSLEEKVDTICVFECFERCTCIAFVTWCFNFYALLPADHDSC